MDVSQALDTRLTCRAFLDTPIPEATVRAILTAAARAPSGGNLQPWRVWALAGEPLAALCRSVTEKLRGGQFGEAPTEYLIYPPSMKDPFADRKRRAGEMMYDAIGVGRDDGAAQMVQLVRNFEFFGAPVGLFLAIDRSLQQGQWADVGMYLQSVMLLAREHELHTAPLESWAMWHRTVRTHLAIPDELMLFCGVGLGHIDVAHPINRIRTERAPLEDFAVLRGF